LKTIIEKIEKMTIDRRFAGPENWRPREKKVELLKATHYMHSDRQPANRIVRFFTLTGLLRRT
jgi:hypothetical protein